MSFEKNLSYYINKSNELYNKIFKKNSKIAILSSFTVNGIEETIRVKCAEKNFGCITYMSGYNQYNQEILNTKSNLYKFSPDITFLLVDTRRIFGDNFHFPYSLTESQRKDFVKEKINDIINLATTFTNNSKSKLVISNLSVPTFSPYGIFETKTKFGFHQMIEEINTELRKFFSNSNSVYIYDFNHFISRFGEYNVFDYQQFFFGDIKISMNYIPYLADDLTGFVVSFLGLSKKCIVLDLDNTLWGGVVGEDGFNGIRLGPDPPGNAFFEFQKVLLSLNQRGIILAINSKNNHEDALKIIQEHPYMILKEENFSSIRINWNDKVSNMKEIIKELNIGSDSIIFLDDDPVNREFMKFSMPEILTIDLPKDPSQYSDMIKKMNELHLWNITDEDVKRGKMYFEQRKRNEFEQTTTNLASFLQNLNLKIIIKNCNEFTIPRISQLTLKTNQFNLTTKRYQESDIEKFSKESNFQVGCAQVTDKFGDNGITGVFIINKENPKQWFLDTFLLSCRVMGREIEKGIMGYIINEAKKNNVEQIKSEFIPTQKNKPSENFLPDCGFQNYDGSWIYSLKEKFIIPECVEVITE